MQGNKFAYNPHFKDDEKHELVGHKLWERGHHNKADEIARAMEKLGLNKRQQNRLIRGYVLASDPGLDPEAKQG